MKYKRPFGMHGLSGFELTTDDSRAVEYFSAEYAFAQEQVAENIPIVELIWKGSALPRSSGDGYRFWIHKLAARWYYRIELSDSGVELDVIGNRTAISMVHHMMLHPSLRWLASQRRTLFLHAAGVARNGRSLLIGGFGGTGKTTTSSALLARGSPEWQLLGDDYVIIGPSGQSFSHATRAHVYLDLTRRFPELSKRLTGAERSQLRLNWTLRRISGDRIKLPVRVELDRMWPSRKLAVSAKPAAVLLLRTSNSKLPEVVPVSSSATAVDELLRNNFYEARHFIKLVGGGKWVDQWMERERELISHFISHVPAYELHLPRGTADIEPIVVDLLEREIAIDGPASKA